HLEDAAGDEDELFLAVVGAQDAHRAGLDAGDQRRVARIDAELAHLARQGDEARLAREDVLLDRDDVDVQRCHVSAPVLWGRHHCTFLAFSNASSIVPIILKPRIVSLSGTYLPGLPVKTSATWNGWLRKRWILRARATASLSSGASS